MFAWTTRGKKIFKKFPKDMFEPTKSLAANQGLLFGLFLFRIYFGMQIFLYFF
jgi:putative membrane protein